MEFRFNLNPLFKDPIIRVNSNLLPETFRGDRRTILDTATKMAEIVNDMGEASAKAQGLNKPVTTAQKLRMSDQAIYLLGDSKQGKNGAVVGLLKVGKKNLYVFDENGDTQMVNAPCVLDFYVHESRQRAGLGKDLFETMLKEEKYVPAKMAVDRPSDKLLGFLRKHYGLQKTIPQMNNFVVYDGFFENNRTNSNHVNTRMHMTSSPNTALFGPQFINDEAARRAKGQQHGTSNVPLIQNAPVGRYAAPRPMGSMAEGGDHIPSGSNQSNPLMNELVSPMKNEIPKTENYSDHSQQANLNQQSEAKPHGNLEERSEDQKLDTTKKFFEEICPKCSAVFPSNYSNQYSNENKPEIVNVSPVNNNA